MVLGSGDWQAGSSPSGGTPPGFTTRRSMSVDSLIIGDERGLLLSLRGRKKASLNFFFYKFET